MGDSSSEEKSQEKRKVPTVHLSLYPYEHVEVLISCEDSKLDISIKKGSPLLTNIISIIHPLYRRLRNLDTDKDPFHIDSLEDLLKDNNNSTRNNDK